MAAEPWGASTGPRRDVATNIVTVQGGVLPGLGCPDPIKDGEQGQGVSGTGSR